MEAELGEMMNALNAQMDTSSQNDLELIDHTTPLATLECDIKNLHNCFEGYREQLSTSLDCPETARRWWGVRLSVTTAGLFAAVALFTLVINAVLTAMRADQQQLLQANCGIGILYVLVCLSVLNDMAGAKTAVRSESEVLQLRVLDVMEQFRELLRTRQAWVEESTRTQWSCETDKLKLQLTDQELQAKLESIAQCRTTWEDLQKSISMAEAQAEKAARDMGDHNAQLIAIQAEHSSLSEAIRELETQRDAMTEQALQSQQQVDHAEQHLAAVTLASEEAQREFDALQKSIGTSRDEASMCDAIVAEQSGLVAELKQQVEAAQQEAEAAKQLFESTVCQADAAQLQLEATKNQIAAAQQKLADTERTIARVQQEACDATSNAELRHIECETLNSQMADLSDRKLEQAEQLAAVSQELVGLREQRENFAAENARLADEHQNLMSALGKLREESQACQAQNEQSMAALQANGQQLMESMAQRLAVENLLESMQIDVRHREQRLAERLQQLDDLNELVHQQENNLAELTEQEAALQDKVDWLLGQLGEFERLSLAQVASSQSVDALESNIRVEQANIDAMKLEEASLQATVAELHECITGLMQDGQLHQMHVEDLKSQSEHLTNDIEQIRMLTEECRLEYADLASSTRQQIADRQAELRVWDDRLQQRSREFEELSVAAVAAQEQLAERQDHIRWLSVEMGEAQALLAEAQQSYATTQQAERVTEERASLLLEKAECIADQVRLRSDELQSAAQELESMQTEIRSLETVRLQFDSLVSDSDKLETRLEQQRAEAIDLSKRTESLRIHEGELQTEVNELTQLVSQLRGELDTLETECQQRQSQLEAHRCELELAHETRENLDRQVALLNGELDRQAEKLRTAENNFDARAAELEQLDGVRSTINVEIERLQGQLAELDGAAEDEQAKLQAIADLYQAKAQSLTEMRQCLEAESVLQHQLENQRAKLISEEDRLNGRVESLTSEVNESQVIANQWHEYIEELKREIERLEAGRQTEQRLLDDAQRRVLLQQDRHDDLLARIGSAADQLADKENERAGLETQARELHNEIARSEGNQLRLLQQVDQADRVLDALLQEQATVQDALGDARLQMEREHMALHEMEAHQAQLRANIESAETLSHQLQIVAEDLQRDKAVLEESVLQLLETKHQLEGEIERSNSQRQSGEEELFQLQTQTQQAQMQLGDIEQEIAQAHVRLSRVTAEHERQHELTVATNNQLLDLQVQIQRVDVESSVKTRELADCLADLARQNETIVSVQEQLDTMLKHVEQLRAEDDELHARRGQLTQELSEQQSEAGKLIALAKHAHKGLQQLTNDAREKELQVSQLQQQLASGDAEVQRNFVRLVDLRNEASELDLQRKEQEQLLQQVALQVTGQSTALANLQQRIETSQAAKISLERNLAQLTSQNERAAQELKGLESQQVQVREQYESQFAEQQQAIEEATQRCQQLLSEEVEVRARIAELQESARMANETLHELAVQQQQAQALLIDSAADLEQSPPRIVELASPKASQSRLQSLEDDVWGAVQSLSQIVQDARMSNASTAGAAAMVDPWATVLADRS